MRKALPRTSKLTEKLITDKSVLLFLAVLILLLYLPAFGNGFVSDDLGLINQNTSFRNFDFLFRDNQPLLEYFDSFFRLLIYWFQSQFCTTASCFRIPNLLFHIGNSFLVYLVVSSFSRRLVGFLVALIFATHPVLSEVVVWISAGNYSQYTFFFLLSLWLYIKTRQETISPKRRTIYYSLSLVFLTFATFTTNRLFGIPIYVLYEVAFGSVKKQFKRLLPFLIIGGFWLMIQYLRLTFRITNLETIAGVDGGLRNPSEYLPLSIFKYLTLFFWPLELSFAHYSQFPSLQSYWLTYLASIITTLLFISLAVWGYLKDRLVFFGVVFFFLGLITVLSPLKVASFVSERYLYLAIIGLILVTIQIGLRLSSTLKRPHWLALGLITVLALFAIRIYQRIPDWRDDVSLTRSILRVNPNIPKAQLDLATSLALQNQIDEAIIEYQKYLTFSPDSEAAHYQLGILYQKKPDLKQAKIHLNKARQANPKSLLTLQALVEISYEEKNYTETVALLQEQLSINPTDPIVHLNLGKVYLETNQMEKAQEVFKKGIKLDPTNERFKQYLTD